MSRKERGEGNTTGIGTYNVRIQSANSEMEQRDSDMSSTKRQTRKFWFREKLGRRKFVCSVARFFEIARRNEPCGWHWRFEKQAYGECELALGIFVGKNFRKRWQGDQ